MMDQANYAPDEVQHERLMKNHQWSVVGDALSWARWALAPGIRPIIDRCCYRDVKGWSGC